MIWFVIGFLAVTVVILFVDNHRLRKEKKQAKQPKQRMPLGRPIPIQELELGVYAEVDRAYAKIVRHVIIGDTPIGGMIAVWSDDPIPKKFKVRPPDRTNQIIPIEQECSQLDMSDLEDLPGIGDDPDWPKD